MGRPRLATPPDLRTALGRMKAARCSAGFTWKRMGYRLRVAETTVKAYETGLRSISYDQLALWAKTCGTVVDWLLLLEGKPPPKLAKIPHVDELGELQTPRPRAGMMGRVHLC